MSEDITDEQAQRISELYAEALANYDDFGTFQLALSNSMTYRSYNWDIDEFECVLERMVTYECSDSTPVLDTGRRESMGLTVGEGER